MNYTQYRKERRELSANGDAWTFADLAYLALGLANEAGEVAGEIKKAWRDDFQGITPERRENIIREMGDVFWYFTGMLEHLDLSFSEVLKINIEKVAIRHGR